jgi:magnesium-protoporphyrin IX monomethyl ester (oxidative) cyclase
MRGQTNYVNMLWKFAKVVNENRQYADHQRPVKYEMRPPKAAVLKPNPADLFVHMPAKLQKAAATGTVAG